MGNGPQLKLKESKFSFNNNNYINNNKSTDLELNKIDANYVQDINYASNESKIKLQLKDLPFQNNETNGTVNSSLEEASIFDEVDTAVENTGATPVANVEPQSQTKPESTSQNAAPVKEENPENESKPAESTSTKDQNTKTKSTNTKYSDIPAVKTSNMDPKGELPGATNDEKIWIYCKSKGFTDAQAAAVVGNAQLESWDWRYSLRDSDNGSYYGLFQSHHKYAPEYNGKSAKEQLDLMNEDLEGRMKYWHGRGYGTSYSTWQSYSGANDVNAATESFMYGYEGTMGNQMLKERQQYARAAYEKYAGKY